MNFLANRCLLALAIGAVWLPLQAGEDFFVGPREPHGVVTGIVNQPAKELWAVRISEVNGRRTERDHGVWLAPGTYSIKADGAVVDRRRTTAVGRNIRTRDRDDFNVELDVEEGKTYYLALDTSGANRSDWKLVVWRVQE